MQNDRRNGFIFNFGDIAVRISFLDYPLKQEVVLSTLQGPEANRACAVSIGLGQEIDEDTDLMNTCKQDILIFN